MNCQDRFTNQAHPRAGFFEQCGVGLGADRSAPAVDESGRRRTDGSARAEAAALRAESKERHFPLHGRRAEPSGAVRQQAAAREVRRHAAAGGPPEGLPRGVHQSELEAARAEVQIRETRPVAAPNCRELLPHTAKIVDDIAIVKSMVTDAFNHAPGQLLMNTGSQQFGRPSMGAWVTYGLGSESTDLPAFVVFSSGKQGTERRQLVLGQRLSADGLSGRAVPQQRRSGAVSFESRRRRQANCSATRSTSISKLNQMRLDVDGRSRDCDADQLVRDGVPDAVERAGTDGSRPRSRSSVLEMYGAEPGKPSFANNCLLARRLVERGVRFVQLYHEAWDQHGNLVKDIKKNCKDTDQACAALVQDLKQRGLLDDTLVIWGGEFGRTPMVQGGSDGRDHHPNAFTMWLAGGGIKPGIVIGETDELGFNVTKDKVHVHDLHATILHLLGFDHTKLTYRFQGRDFRLTDVHGQVFEKLLL